MFMQHRWSILCLLLIYCHRSYQQDYSEDFSYSVNNDDPRSQVVTQVEDATNRALELRYQFWRSFKNLTDFDRANKTFRQHVRPKLKFVRLSTSSRTYDDNEDLVSSADIEDKLARWKKSIEVYLEKKIEALRNLVNTAEAVVANYSVKPPPFDENCNMSYVDVRESNATTDFFENSIAIHIPIGVVNCSGLVQRDITWLGNEDFQTAFEANLRKDPEVLRQYIAATDSGVTRLFPVAPWKLEKREDPKDITVDLFDARSRHWLIRAITCPKDIMFLVDLSGSVSGQTRHLMKLTVMTILTTLTPDDYINAVWYNKDVDLVFSKCFDGFIPATTRNKMLLQEYLNQKAEHEADFEKAVNFTYNEFLKWDNLSRIHSELHYGSGCHKSLFILTDTVQETGQELYEKYRFNNDTLDIRLFGFAMGFNTLDIEALQLLSCRRNGGYFKVDSLEDIRDESRAYISVLSRSLAMSMFDKPLVESRTVSWTGPYMDAQLEGPVLTISMPILNKMKGGANDRFVGVAGIDIKLSALQDLADAALNSVDSYVFAADNNGNILFHPNLHTPETDVQMVRRTACFEATPAKRKSEADKVLFWDPTEDVKMQMGQMDSMFTIDLAEIENPTSEMLELREKMVSGQCDRGQIYVSENVVRFGKRYAKKVGYSYRCRKLSGTPYSIGFAMKRRTRALSATVKDQVKIQKHTFYNNSVAWLPSPRIYCSADLSAESVEDAWNKLANTLYEADFECSDSGRASRLILDYEAVVKWLDRSMWLEEDVNETCLTNMFALKEKREVDLVFIQTEGGLTAFYPKCSGYMPTGLKKDIRQSEYFQYARLWPNDLNFMWTTADTNSLTVFAAIHDQEQDYTLAVVGAQVPIQHIWELWRPPANQTGLSRSFRSCWDNSGQSVCYLMTRHFMIIDIAGSATTISPSLRLHLGSVEPSLFEYLANRTDNEKITFTDFQDRCRPGEDRMPSVSDAKSVRLLSIVDLFYGILSGFNGIWSSGFWLNVWSLITTLCSPSADARLADCKTKRPRLEEHCIRTYHLHVFEPSGSSSQGDLVFYDDGCEKDLPFKWTKIEGTNLYLLDVYRPPGECRKGRPPLHPFTPVRRVQCDILQEQMGKRSRRRHRSDCVAFHEKETLGDDDDTCSAAMQTPMRFLVIGLLLLYFCNSS